MFDGRIASDHYIHFDLLNGSTADSIRAVSAFPYTTSPLSKMFDSNYFITM